MLPTSKTKNLKWIGSGVECKVYKVDNGTVYKEYKKYELKYLAQIYETAIIANKNGIAPDVYDRDSTGYYTELVQVFNELTCKGCKETTTFGDGRKCKNEGFCLEPCDKALAKPGFTQDDYDKLESAANKLSNKRISDLHPANIGIKDNKLVLIDFGQASFSYGWSK